MTAVDGATIEQRLDRLDGMVGDLRAKAARIVADRSELDRLREQNRELREALAVLVGAVRGIPAGMLGEGDQ